MIADAADVEFVHVALAHLVHCQVNEKTERVQSGEFHLVRFYIHRLTAVARVVGVRVAFERVALGRDSRADIEHLCEAQSKPVPRDGQALHFKRHLACPLQALQTVALGAERIPAAIALADVH